MAKQFEQLPGLETLPNIDLGARNAFARVPTPKYFGVDPTIFENIDPEAVALAQPDDLSTRLFAPKAHHAIDGVVFSVAEYATIPRNVEALARQVGANTLKAQVAGPLIDADRYQRGQRSISHTLESKLPMLRDLYHYYNTDLALLAWMNKEIGNHWMAHTNELDMRSKVMHTRMIFDGMFTAVADSEGWDVQTRINVDAAHQKQLLIGKFNNKKVYWQDMVYLAHRYTSAKRSLVLLRGRRIAGRVK